MDGVSESRSKSSSPHLPMDIVSEIISRLPVKSLLRFKSVCKSWYYLIHSPTFVAKHLECFSRDGVSPFLFHLGTSNGEPHVLSMLREDTLEVAIDYAIPASIKARVSGFWGIIGSCNGLLAVNGCFIILWNPATGQFRRLPPAKILTHPDALEWISFGFGFNPEDRTNHKLVRTVYLRGKMDEVPKVQVEIYAESTDSWREIDAAFPTWFDERSGLSKPYTLRTPRADAVVDDILHWAANTEEGCANAIVAFDMKNEVFRQIPLPPSGRSPSDHCLSVAVFRGCLGTLILPYKFGCGGTYIDVWVMREYGIQNSWTKQFVIGPILSPPRKIVGFWENGEIILEEYLSEPRLHDPITQLTKAIPITELACSLSYKESLVSVYPRNAAEVRPMEFS